MAGSRTSARLVQAGARCGIDGLVLRSSRVNAVQRLSFAGSGGKDKTAGKTDVILAVKTDGSSKRVNSRPAKDLSERPTVCSVRTSSRSHRHVEITRCVAPASEKALDVVADQELSRGMHHSWHTVQRPHYADR